MKRWMCVVTILFVLSVACKSKQQDEQKDKDQNPEKLALVQNLKLRVQQAPDSASLRMQLVTSLDSLGMYKEALAQTDSMIKRDSANNGLWYTKGQLQESNKDTLAAIQSYRRAVAIYPSTEAQLSLANLYAETKNPNALTICQSVTRMGYDREINANCDFIAGVYYSRTGNRDQAIRLFDHSIKNNYTLMEAYMEKGFIYYDEKKYDEALKTFGTAITINNLYADAYYWQAKCYEAMGNKQDAITNYQRSLGLDKSLQEARTALARLGE